jgi:hypothetical protein
MEETFLEIYNAAQKHLAPRYARSTAPVCALLECMLGRATRARLKGSIK